MPSPRRSLLVGLLALLSLAARTEGQEADRSVPAGFLDGWHVVRPGETLELIATRYMGNLSFWREIHRLNPGIADPDLIEPGQRIRILLKKGGPAAAQVHRVARRVEEQPSPHPWSEARVGDVLVERDGLRTYRKSSAEVAFTDGARLVVTEDSLVFLRRTGSTLRGERRQVEIVEGQADLEARPAARTARAPEVEIVLGSARATSRPGSSGAAQTRARRPAEGGAKVMVYDGEGEVEAAGARVQVPQGMGTSVAEQGPPSPPELLLPAPRLTGPEPGAELACSNPALSWEEVPDAASYTVEVCRDPGCGELVERQTGLTTAAWQAEGLPLAALHWRVTARSRSGLDGYPSAPAGLAITSDQADLQPPAGTLRLAGPQVSLDGRLFVASAPVPEVAAEDAETGVARWLPVIDGQPGTAWPTSWTAGEHTAAALVVDRCGRRGILAPVAFVVDDEPPSIKAETGSLASFADRMPEPRRESRTRRREKKQKDPGPDALLWSSGWDRWETLAGEVEIPSDSLQLFFRAPAGWRFEGGEALYLYAEDAGARLDRVRFRSRSTPEGMVLEVEAVDLVGNVAKQEWVVAGPPS